MIDHIGVNVRDFEKSQRFYAEALKPLGYSQIVDWGKAGLFGDAAQQGYLWVGEGGPVVPFHLAMAAADRATVAAFHRAAGGKDNGAPGLRPQYHLSYYGAFVLDTDGYNVEAVCHRPE